MKNSFHSYLPGLPKKFELPKPRDIAAELKSFFHDPVLSWQTVVSRPDTFSRLFEKYVFYLAAIPPISGYIGYVIFGDAGSIRGIVVAVSGYIICIAFMYGATYLAKLSATMFGGRLTIDESAKLIIYSFMPIFLCALFLALPPLRFLTIGGVWGLYLFYRGILVVARIPPSRQLTYFAMNCVSWMVCAEFARQTLMP